MIEIKRTTQKLMQPAQERLQQPVEAQNINTTQQAQNAQKRQFKPFTGLDGSCNYREMYRAAFDFHNKHGSASFGNDGGASYWEEITNDIEALAVRFNNNPFLLALLTAVTEELERVFEDKRNAESS